MKCLSFIKKHTGTFMLFCSLFVSFFVSSLSVSNSYALQDISVTYTSGTVWTSYQNLFSGLCDDSCMRQYSYLIVDLDTNSRQGWSFNTKYYNQARNNQTFFSGIYFLHNDNYSLEYINASNSSAYLTLTFDITLTLTDSYTTCPPGPSGSITLSQNGTFDVTNYAEAVVEVPPEVLEGDYHQDLINITNGIYVCAGTILVIYFFYCIYRLIIKNSGVK